MHVFRVALLFFVALAASVASTLAGAVTTFGPMQFVRGAGSPTTVAQPFVRCAGSPCRLVVLNGNADGTNRVSSATVELNGKQLFGPSDFKPSVARLEVPVDLQDSDQLEVTLRSAPGSFLTISVECDTAPVIAIGPAAVATSLWSDKTLSLSIPLTNVGEADADNVSITGMTADGGSYVGPTPFAYGIGDLGADEGVQLAALFKSVDASTSFPLAVRGTYGFATNTCPFVAQANVDPPPPGNGGQPKSQTTVTRFTVDTAVFPPAPLPHPADAEPNEEPGYMPPLGPPRNLFPVPPSATLLNKVAGFNPGDTPPPGAGANDVVFFRNANGGSYNGLPPDPSTAGATPGGFVMLTANTAVSYSTDFGKTFTVVNLTKGNGFSDPGNPGRPDFFPEVDGGLCCDQVLHYVPGRNLMIWLLQYWSPSVTVGGLSQLGQNRLRIAFATPEAAAADFLHAWSWFDISPTTLGDTTVTDWMDYPDLAYSNDWLYISVDHGLWNPAKNSAGNIIGQQVYNGRRWFVRASLNDMAAGAGSINLVYYEGVKSGLVKAHFAQSSPSTMYFAAQPDTSTLSVFADPDSSPDIPTPKDLQVSQYCQSTAKNQCDYTVNAPDNLDWNVAPHGVLGATYVDPGALCPPGGCSGPTRFVYFAFDGGRDTTNNRAFPYVRVEKVDADAINLVSELDIWNPGFAFATPGLTWRPGSFRDEVAISLAVGGGGSYADNSVGFLGDFVVYLTTSSNATQSNAKPTVRYGDYFHARNAFAPVVPDAGQGLGYSTLAYAVTQAVSGKTCAQNGCNVTLQYVLFGRNQDLFPSAGPPIK